MFVYRYARSQALATTLQNASLTQSDIKKKLQQNNKVSKSIMLNYVDDYITIMLVIVDYCERITVKENRELLSFFTYITKIIKLSF